MAKLSEELKIELKQIMAYSAVSRLGGDLPLHPEDEIHTDIADVIQKSVDWALDEYEEKIAYSYRENPATVMQAIVESGQHLGDKINGFRNADSAEQDRI